MKIHIHALFAALVATASQTACTSTDRTDGRMHTTTADGRTVTVEAIDSFIVRVDNTAPGQAHSATQATVLRPQPFRGTIRRSADSTVMTLPSGLAVTLYASSGAVAFTAADGRRLLYDAGERMHTGLHGDTLVSVELEAAPGGTFYGAGERGHRLALNADTLEMYNSQNYGYADDQRRISRMGITMPVLTSTLGYTLLFDDYGAATLTTTDPITYTSESADPVSYFFIYGSPSDMGAATERFTALTGRQELPPLWALGYITSKYGYRTEAEARAAVDSLRALGYPLDGIVLDLYWYGSETDMGRLAWDTIQWPDHRQMLADFAADGVNTVLISQPYINKKGAIGNYMQLDSLGLLTRDASGATRDVTTWVGEAGMFDMANPDTRAWLTDRYRQLTDEGVAGWWGDLGEPEVHPSSIVHHNGQKARQYHNVYGNQWSRTIYDLFAEQYPDRRLMTLMRGGTTGLQRYSVFPWSTDVERSWGGLRPQVRIMLGSGLSGLGYMSHDVGGFAVDSLHPSDPELYVRWMQLGVFSPVLRTHAQLLAEPFNYPEQNEVLRHWVDERYRWLPYNYTLAYENASRGWPLVRPVNFHAPADTTLSDLDTQYLWGDALLVAPIMEPGATQRRIVIPAGEWVDYNRPTVSYTGPDTIAYHASLAEMPLLVRAGSIIPRADYPMRNTRDYDPTRYTVYYYPRASSQSSLYSLYEDDLASRHKLAPGTFALVRMQADSRDGRITFAVSTDGSYPGMPAQRRITVVLPGVKAAQAIEVTAAGKKISPVPYGTDGWLSYSFTAPSDSRTETTVSLR